MNLKVCSIFDRIRDIRLQELDIDFDEYLAQKEDTDFDTVITLCEEGIDLLRGVK